MVLTQPAPAFIGRRIAVGVVYQTLTRSRG
jgi:hypothetical protein